MYFKFRVFSDNDREMIADTVDTPQFVRTQLNKTNHFITEVIFLPTHNLKYHYFKRERVRNDVTLTYMVLISK